MGSKIESMNPHLNTTKYSNALIHQSSPYLLQHAHQPVNWLPFGKEAFAIAQSENKLILFSVGYSACHWCHVMAHESFDDEQIADLMNQHFVCVKVDREERPDVDQIYMNAVQLLTGSGGWPLNCFALPDGRPVWGGTYFRPNDWRNILKSLSKGYQTDQERYLKAADGIMNGFASLDLKPNSQQPEVDDALIFDSVERLKANFDAQNGGFKGSPKFPMPGLIIFLLNSGFEHADQTVLKQVDISLQKMAYGGIYDQLAGGFARYSVDAKWLVPHFEKMLYDNAQLISLYSKAYRVYKKPIYKRIVEETLSWLFSEMKSTQGLFYSAYDADSEGSEGKYYVWSKVEIETEFPNQADLISEYFGISADGNFEGSNILTVPSLTEPKQDIEALKKRMLEIRHTRVKPGLDSKTITSWNALTISALCDAYESFGNPDYLNQALETMQVLLRNRWQAGHTLLRFDALPTYVSGLFDDYALTINALIDLNRVCFDDQYLYIAKDMLDLAQTIFFDASSELYFYARQSDELVVRTHEITDNVIPSSNAVMAHNLLKMSQFFGRADWEYQALSMLKKMSSQIERNPSFSYHWLDLAQHFALGLKEQVLIGNQAMHFKKEIDSIFQAYITICGNTKASNLPIFEGRWNDEQTLIYECIHKACRLPTDDFKRFIEAHTK